MSTSSALEQQTVQQTELQAERSEQMKAKALKKKAKFEAMRKFHLESKQKQEAEQSHGPAAADKPETGAAPL